MEWDFIGCAWVTPVVYASLDSGGGFDVGAGVLRVVASARGRKNPLALRCCSSKKTPPDLNAEVDELKVGSIFIAFCDENDE